MSRDTEKRLIEVVRWYDFNMDRVPRDHLEKRIQFLTVTCNTLLEILTRLAEDLRPLEHREKKSGLYLPAGVTLTDDDGSPMPLRANGE